MDLFGSLISEGNRDGAVRFLGESCFGSEMGWFNEDFS